jgi:hypothetical protein
VIRASRAAPKSTINALSSVASVAGEITPAISQLAREGRVTTEHHQLRHRHRRQPWHHEALREDPQHAHTVAAAEAILVVLECQAGALRERLVDHVGERAAIDDEPAERAVDHRRHQHVVARALDAGQRHTLEHRRREWRKCRCAATARECEESEVPDHTHSMHRSAGLRS